MADSNLKFNRVETYLPILVVTTFVFVALFGLSLSMPTDAHGNMASCPWMSETATVCPMGVAEHIAHWQRMLTVTLEQDVLLLMLALVAFVIVLYIFNWLSHLEYLFAHYYQRYKREHPNSKLFSYLHVIFADGILQPKLYA